VIVVRCEVLLFIVSVSSFVFCVSGKIKYQKFLNTTPANTRTQQQHADALLKEPGGPK